MKNVISSGFLLVAFLLTLSSCNTEKSYKYHTFVYAFDVDDPSAQCCIVVCGQPDDDVVWVELPQSYYEAANYLVNDSCYYWYTATDDKLYNSNSYHNFYSTGEQEDGYALFSNNTGFTVGLNERHDYVYFMNQQARTPLHIPLQKKVILYER